MPVSQREVLTMALVVLIFGSIIVSPAGASLAPGSRLTINSSPPGATAYIDGYRIGTTPVSREYLAYGNYIISITLNGYQTYVHTVYIPVYGAPVMVNATLEPDTTPAGGIHIRTDPFNTSVCIDNDNCQAAPADFNNLSGNTYHVVTIRQGDQKVWYENVMVVPLAITDVNEVLQPDNATVGHIRVTGQGGLICVDNLHCQSYPDFDVEGNRYHSVTVLSEGYRPFTTEIFVEPNQIRNITIDPQQKRIPGGFIEVNTTIAGGTVCLDGTRCDVNIGSIDGFGRTRFVDVNAMTLHRITVNKTGYLPYSANVSVSAGQTTIVDVPLHLIESESMKAKLTTIVNICSNWNLWCNHSQEKTKDTNPSLLNESSLTTQSETIQSTNANVQTTSVPNESPLLSDIVKPGDMVSIDLKIGNNKNNITINSQVSLLAGQTTASDNYCVFPGTSDQSPDSRIFVFFSNEYNAISSGIVGMKPGEQKNISVHFKDKIETKTMSSEYLKKYKINASNLSAGQLFVGIYTEPNSSTRSTALGKIVSATRDYALVDYSYPDIQVTILQIMNSSINTTTSSPIRTQSPAIQRVSPMSGPTSGGTLVTITGTNLSSIHTIIFGRSRANSIINVSDTTITAITPPSEPGMVSIFFQATQWLGSYDGFEFIRSPTSSNSSASVKGSDPEE